MDGKDRPLWWRLEHASALWVMALVTEKKVQDTSLDEANSPKDRGARFRQWESSRTALKLLVEPCEVNQVNIALVQDVRKEPSGKPYLINSFGEAVPVALAHTSGMGAAAIPLDHGISGIGVDVEQFSTRFLRVVSRIALVEEVEIARKAVPGNGEAEAAALIWVIKEACYKAAFVQDALFGKNQTIKTIELKEDSLDDDVRRWSGSLDSGKKDSMVSSEFEAGTLRHDQALWYWAVAWRRA